MLPDNQFNNIIRFVRRGSADEVAQIRHATFSTLKRLGVGRDVSKAVVKTPSGSDQVDTQSIVVWMNQIQIHEKKSVAQLIAIDATAVARG